MDTSLKFGKQKIHLIANAHIDPVWLWRWQEGFAEILATFRSQLDRMDEFPEYKFTSACAAYYQWVENVDPLMFEQIRNRVKEGRWCIAGGWFLQPDCNIPCGESFSRHGLISQRYFLEKFGIMAKTGYNVDSFGHNGMLPQILRKSGMDSYIFMRPEKHEKDMPANLFDWQSPDGSVVRTFRIPMSYGMACDPEKYRLLNEKADAEGVPYMGFYGVGNHGGGATIKLLNILTPLTKDHKNFVFSTPDEYFREVGDLNVPIVADDLQYHAKGCYSACTQIKQGNRSCENNVLTAEMISVMASKLFDVPYPKKRLAKAWKNILFNQFHDIMGGCSIKDAYTDAGYLHSESMSITEQVINYAMQKISWNIDTLMDSNVLGCKDNWSRVWEHDSLGTPIIVFNPLSWSVKTSIQINECASLVTDSLDNEIPIQKVRGPHTNGKDKYNTIFNADIPAYGYRMYRMFTHKEPAGDVINGMVCDSTSIENELIKLTFDRFTGALISYYDKTKDQELLSKDTEAAVYDDSDYDTWAHGIKAFDRKIGQFKNVSVTNIENGPVRSIMRVVMNYGDSMLCQDYMILSNDKRVTVRARVDFREKHRIFKIIVPVNVTEPKAYCEMPYGYIERKTDGDEQSGQKWMAVIGKKGGLGFANTSKYSFSVSDNVFALTILRTAIYADHFGDRDEFVDYMDLGVHDFIYTMFPYESLEASAKNAYELNMPVRHIIETFHHGTLGGVLEGIYVSSGNIIVTAIKDAEDEDGTILRAYESSGEDTDVVITSPLWNTKIDAHFGHNEFKTFKIAKDGTVTEVDLLER